ncbi:hypothetical protein [Streptosporangium sp. NPDC000396]|uniref:hypothetical protein n=1 Tax=Streptosporangium sp. NPDC000396 TaxID=3366185 RepID=UPI00368922E4
MFELAEAVLCSDGPGPSLVGLSLAGEHRRGHGSVYVDGEHGRWGALAVIAVAAAATGAAGTLQPVGWTSCLQAVIPPDRSAGFSRRTR